VRSFSANFGKTVAKSATISADSGNIPYASEQRHCLADQGIEVPCSADNRDNSRLMRRLFGASAWKRSRPKDGDAADRSHAP
jgi:hypothetical protein